MPHPTSTKHTDHYDDPDYNYKKYWEGREYEHAAEKMAIERLLTGHHFKHAVDVGGGYGRVSVLLEQYADKITLAEPSSQQLYLAQDYTLGHAKIELQKMRGDELKFSDNSVDLVTMIRVMHHLPDPSQELSEIARILTSDGYAIIEAANYTHARNRLKHLLHRKKMPSQPVDIRSIENQHEDEIPFVNHNPKTVIKLLAHAGLRVERILSVSNLRSGGIKRLMPRRVMLAVEGLLQPTLAHGYFGPSVFFLVKKIKK